MGKVVFKCSVFVLLGLSLVLVGCSAGSRKVEPAFKEGGRLRKIAVMPFYNMSGRREAGHIVSDTFVSELFASDLFNVEEPGNVRSFMIREHVDTVGELEIERIRILGMRLKADALLIGTVEEFDEGLRSGVPAVSVSARIIDARNGRLVWAGYRKRRGSDYIIAFDIGKVRSATALTQKIAAEMIETIEW